MIPASTNVFKITTQLFAWQHLGCFLLPSYLIYLAPAILLIMCPVVYVSYISFITNIFVSCIILLTKTEFAHCS